MISGSYHSLLQKIFLNTGILLIVSAFWSSSMSLGALLVHQTQNAQAFPNLNISHHTGQKESIKIGLLLPASPDDDLLANSALKGAELAVSQANEAGGFKGRHFELVSRTTDGLWGAGSKESVEFVHNDEVVAIVTSVDGRNAHLAEQVTAKSQVVQIATRATEETLSQAYVPWFFRIVPNDVQQSEALVEEVFINQGFSKVHALYENTYDGSNGANSFGKTVTKRGFQISGESAFTKEEADSFDPEIPEGTEALVVFGSFLSVSPILDRIKELQPSIQVFGALSMTGDGLIGAGYSEGCEGGIFVSSKFCFTTPGQAFKDHYVERFHQMPNPAASYAYDGVGLVIEAVMQAGPDRQKIRDALKDIDYKKGATGPIHFDSKGNRTSPVFLIRLIKGHPVILNP